MRSPFERRSPYQHETWKETLFAFLFLFMIGPVLVGVVGAALGLTARFLLGTW